MNPYSGYGLNGGSGYPIVGRGVPDISLLGVGYTTIFGGKVAGPQPVLQCLQQWYRSSIIFDLARDLER